MACQRNRIIELQEYLSSLGISVNIGKNKARGHKGIFMHSFNNYRIDIAKNIGDENILSVIMHEFAHYVHYTYDNSLKSLGFVFGEMSDDINEELIKITVNEVPKEFAASLYEKEQVLKNELTGLTDKMRQLNPSFKLSVADKKMERALPLPVKYLLKYDRIKYFNKIYSIDGIENDFDLTSEALIYIKIKSMQRTLKRIRSRINRLNKYYNNPSELFARFVDAYYTKPDLAKKLAPKSCELMNKSNLSILEPVNKILLNK